ncbi:hypothetical protein AH97_12370 [Salmonella enterica subsp. enterica]|nr:hypothetical protein [Salmonella enterica subsp. enterica serovar Hartford]
MMDKAILTAIKRVAMETAYFCVSPFDDDNGFDRLMSCKTPQDLQNCAFGDIFLHSFLQGRRILEIKNQVINSAIQLVVVFEHTSPDIAETMLLKKPTPHTIKPLSEK